VDTSPALQSPSSPVKKRTRWQFYLAGLLTLGFLIYFFQPAFSTWWLRRHLARRALDHGATVTFRKIEADFFSGYSVLWGVQIRDRTNSENQANSAEVQLTFSPWRLLFKKEISPIQKVIIGKTDIRWKWQAAKEGKRAGKAREVFRNRFPDELIGTAISADIEFGNGRVSMEDADFHFAPKAAGRIDIPSMNVTFPPWKRSFSNLQGSTAIKERAFYVGGIKFTPNLVLERGSLDFTEPDRHKITSELLFSAFGGQWRTNIDFKRRKTPVEITAAATFWNLSVDQLGEFVGNEQLAEGVIHEGGLTFHGNPGEFTKANTTLRFNATNFRWHERQWNSLVASVLLVNRRIEIPQFDLVQSKNQIQLKGHADLPATWTQLPSEFRLQVLAEIDDLESATRLMWPSQKEIGGEAFFAGEVRNENGKFSGNLKMRGGPLKISGVAVDRVRGDLKLEGSEVNATALEFVRRDDKAAGFATLNLAQPVRYSGEFQVNAANMADYAAILPPAFAEHAAAGGVKLWWSGDGTNRAHSGAFRVTLRDFLVSRATTAVPLDVESDGSYSPAGITLNHLTLQRPNVKLTSAVAVRPDSLELRDLRVAGTGGATITGNLTLPLNLLSYLSRPTLASLLDSKAASNGQITGKQVRLDEFSELSGTRQPVRGRATFDLTTDGPLESLIAKLELGLKDFSAPENISIPELKATAKLAANQLEIEGEMNPGEKRDHLLGQLVARLALSQANLIAGHWLDENAPLSGSMESRRFALPLMHPWWPAARVFKGDAGGILTLNGTAKAPVFEGQLNLLETAWHPAWLPHPLQKLEGPLSVAGETLRSEKITGSYRGGSFTASGSMGLDVSQNMEVTVEGKALTLASSSDRSEAVVDGWVLLRGPANQRSIEGQVLLQSAVLHRELTLSTPTVALPAASRFSLPWVPPDWNLDLEVTAAEPFEIRGKENTWEAQMEWILRETARTPTILGMLQLRPTGLTKTAPGVEEETFIYFINSTLENGSVEDAQPAVAAELAPPPPVELAVAPPTPAPDPEPIPRRLEITPVAP
jgi:hypothetical protein